MNAHQIKAAVSMALMESRPANFSSRVSFLKNLEFVYHAIVASEDLLKLAILHCDDKELRSYFLHHLTEETGHAEWLAEDLKAAGHEIGTAPQMAVAMVGSVYYLIRHLDPAALLGYMVPMECFPAPMEQVEALEAAHGASMVRTVRHHAEHDVSHGADVLEQIDRLPESKKAIVLECALQTARYMALASHTF